jgi:hypothetical protein
MGEQNLLSRTLPCFGRHFKPLVSAAFKFQGRLTSGRWPVVKIIAESLLQHEKHVVPTPLSVGKGQEEEVLEIRAVSVVG